MKFIKITWILVLCILFSYSAFSQKDFSQKQNRKVVPASSVTPNFKNLNLIQRQANVAPVKGSSVIRRGAQLPRVVLKLDLDEKRVGQVVYSPKTKLPVFISTPRSNATSRRIPTFDVSMASLIYLDELKPILTLENPAHEFAIRKIQQDKFSKHHVRMLQKYEGVPIYGAEVIVHLNEYGEGEAFNGHYYALKQAIDIHPGIEERSVVEQVKRHAALGHIEAVQEKSSLEKLLSQDKPEVTLYVYADPEVVKRPVLAYHVIYYPSVYHRLEYFIDAHSGEIIRHFESTCSIDDDVVASSAPDLYGISRSFNTINVGGTYHLIDTQRPMYNGGVSSLPDNPIGAIMTLDMKNSTPNEPTFYHVTSTSQNSWDATAVSAHYNGGIAYEYYLNTFNRNSIDGQGGTIISVINVADPDTGNGFDNAFWNGKAMFYGNGLNAFKKLAKGMDVAGHEMTHGVVQHTANLEYQGESGAINESMADIFGCMMDPDDWQIGEDVVLTSVFSSGALRDMQDPHNGGSNLNDAGYQPAHMSEKYNGSEDNGGVHINSGICNKAFYLLATAISRNKAAAIYYHALSNYLTMTSNFADLRIAVIKAAEDLYGKGNESNQAAIAFDGVGIGGGSGGSTTPPQQTLPTNPGDEYMLVYNTDTDYPGTLFVYDGTDFYPLSNTPFHSRPSVLDNGSEALFIGADNNLYGLAVDPDNPGEELIDDSGIWSNVVVSKDGTKVAVVSNMEDGKIYVLDLVGQTFQAFELYNPTYTEGVVSAGPAYADALEFDYSGEYLVYDAFNVLEGESNISYWDVGLIKVWDNATNDYGDGSIFKLFSALPDGVSIGNPTFSKLSPNILAFDYYSENEDAYAVLGFNIETNKVGKMADNISLGWPSFNKDDSRVAFTSYEYATGKYNINQTSVNADKISGGAVEPLIINGKWSVYLAAGERVFYDEVTAVESQSEGVYCYPNPFRNDLIIKLEEENPQGSLIIRDALGKVIGVHELTGTSMVQLQLGDIAQGYYLATLKTRTGLKQIRLIKH